MRHFVRPANLLVAALLVFASCDAADNLLFEPAPQNQASHLESDSTVVEDDSGNDYTLVEADIKFPKLTASKWIGRGGGLVVLEGTSRDGVTTVMHALIVPDGAVKHRTLFTISVASPHFIKVDLRAQIEKKVKGETTLIDVGHQGFHTPVIVALDHSLASNIDDPSRLTLLYDPENGQKWQRKGGSILAGYENWLVTYLDHFSKYAVALD